MHAFDGGKPIHVTKSLVSRQAVERDERSIESLSVRCIAHNIADPVGDSGNRFENVGGGDCVRENIMGGD